MHPNRLTSLSSFRIKDYEAGASKLVEVLERRTRIEREIETKVLQLGEMYQEAYDEMRLVLEGRLSDLEHFMKETRTGKQ